VENEVQASAGRQWISLRSGGGLSPRGELAIQDLHSQHWQNLKDDDGFPKPPSTMTLAGDDLWGGGEGAIARVDLKTSKVRNFCHISVSSVDQIQVGGGYVWVQLGEYLYRVPLSALP